ncbi:MAG: response regulator [Syntrophomonadaceae bacterium]|nr:response regulator [Syntrophomonadaceae bacterium]
MREGDSKRALLRKKYRIKKQLPRKEFYLNHKRYQAILENQNDMVIRFRADLTISYANETVCRYFNCSYREIMTAHLLDGVCEEDVENVLEFIKKSLFENRGSICVRVKNSHGEIGWTEWSGGVILAAPSSVEIQVVGRNIAERKRMEEELNNSRLNLSRLAEESEKKLTHVDQLKNLGVLAGGIAHDFNNLLTVISGNISLATMMHPFPDNCMELLKEVEKAALQARDLTRQLMVFSKGEDLFRETASIRELLQESIPFLLRGSSVKCELSIQEKLRPVEINKGQVGQVINNLVINALQAMPDGGILHVEASNGYLYSEELSNLPEGWYIKITVRDQGEGIPEEYLNQIFDPYFTTKKEGNGLGLYSSLSIIRQHGGDIQAENTLGEGTAFHVYIPVAIEDLVGTEYPVKHMWRGKILIMDDQESVRNTLGRMVTHLGYVVEYARDGMEALEKYQRNLVAKQPFNAVIMDLTVPGAMGGREATQRILNLDNEAKVILTSGYANDMLMEDFAAYGYCEAIPKPYSMDSVIKALTEIMIQDKKIHS